MAYKSGFVALLGRPNVGKSTLLNKIVGQKIAIESPVAQTTRHRIKGVVTAEKGQIVFLDTPGFSKAVDKLGEYLTQEAEAALSEADAFVMVVDGSNPPGKGDEWVAEQLRKTGKFVLLVVNKADTVKDASKRPDRLNAYKTLFKDYQNWQAIWVSAKTGKNVESVADTVIRRLPEGPQYYPEDAATDQRLREIAAEMIREKVLLNTREEIPHSVAIGIETFDESDPAITRIKATLYVDQESQKGILIGEGGKMIKTIGTQARKDIEELLEGQKVHLELLVKLKKNWRKDDAFLKSLGLAPPVS